MSVIEVGEEAGTPTRLLNPGDLLVRLDVLDGSTNAKVTMSDFSSVALVDRIPHRMASGRRRGHHVAGAITVATGWTISWENQGRYEADRDDYRPITGDVYVSAEPWGVPEFELPTPSWIRRAHSSSAVASKRRRLDEALRILGVQEADDVFYNFGGTPIVAALLMGQLENVIEPSWVTLHDSAHLIPHQLLHGAIERTDDHDPLDYLALYEANALNLDPTHKPVPPYWARGGLTP